MIEIILVVLVICIIIWYLYSPTYMTCTKCGYKKAKVNFRKDVWICPECGYGKYLRR